MDTPDSLTIREAARELGCTETAVSQMIHKQLIPCEKIGRRIYVERAVISAVAQLKADHGRKWAKHAPWNGGEGQTPVSDVPSGLNAELLKLSRKYIASGHPDIACKLQDVLIEQYGA